MKQYNLPLLIWQLKTKKEIKQGTQVRKMIKNKYNAKWTI